MLVIWKSYDLRSSSGNWKQRPAQAGTRTTLRSRKPVLRIAESQTMTMWSTSQGNILPYLIYDFAEGKHGKAHEGPQRLRGPAVGRKVKRGTHSGYAVILCIHQNLIHRAPNPDHSAALVFAVLHLAKVLSGRRVRHRVLSWPVRVDMRGVIPQYGSHTCFIE